MGMMIGTRNTYVKTVTFKNIDGTTAGTLRMTKHVRKKKFNYNFKKISTQIINAKTSSNARKAAALADSQIAILRQKLLNSEYDSKELESALSHSLKMKKISVKKMKNLQQEERISRKNGNYCIENKIPEDELDVEKEGSENTEIKQKAEELEKLIREFENAIAQSEQLQESNSFLTEIIPEDNSHDELALLKKKHRAEEMKKIMEADLQYLKAMFERLEKEKHSTGSFQSDGWSDGEKGVSLELVGMEVPLQLTEAAVLPESGSVDIMV